MAERSERKVFGQAFFKKLAVGKAEPYALALMARSAGKKLGKQGVLVPSGDRSGPTEAAAEKRPAFPGR